MVESNLFHLRNQKGCPNLLLCMIVLLLAVPLPSCSADNDVGTDQCNLTEIAKAIVPYLYIQDSEGQMGGMRSVAKIIYLAADGVGQLTVEGSDDTVEKVVRSSVQCKAFFQKLDKFVFPRKKKPKTTVKSSGTLVTEYYPASVYIEFFNTKGEIKKYSCNPNELPEQVVELIKDAKDMVLEGKELSEEMAAERCIRSSILSEETTKEMKRAKIIQEVSFEEIKKQQLIYSALTHPRMLIAVPKDTNPYEFIKKSFQRGRSIQLSVKDMSFQIRNIIKPKTKEPKK